MNKIANFINPKIVKQEIKNYLKFSIIWLAAILGMFLLYASFFNIIEKEAENFVNLFKNLPEETLAIFGGSEVLESITTFSGYYTMISQIFFLIAAIEAIFLGLNLLNKEFKDKTIEFIAIKPVKRHCLITSKLIAGLLILIVTNIIIISTTLLMGAILMKPSEQISTLFLLSFSLFLIQLLFFATGFLVSTIFNKLESTTVVGMGIVFFSFFLGALLSAKIKAVRLISFFYYYPKNYILKHGHYELLYLIMTFVVIIIFIASSYILYQRKDLTN